MKMKVTIWTYALLASCGAALGILTASSVHATSTHDVYVNPGASTNSLTCGWHDVCKSPYTWSNALDWGNDAYTNKYVYWRSWSVVASGSGTMAYGYPYNASSTICFGAGVNLYDTSWGYRGSVVYLHTSLSGSAPTVYVQGNWSGTFTSAGPMGTTVSAEKDVTCLWDAAHLHQYSTASGWWANTEVYPNAVNPQTGYDLSAFGNWQNRTNWTEQYGKCAVDTGSAPPTAPSPESTTAHPNRQSPMPDSELPSPPIETMLAKLTPELPGGAGWLYEPKWDGFRCIVYFDGTNDPYLQSRDLKPLG